MKIKLILHKFKKMGRILAIDYGLRRVGIAVTDPLKIIAHSLTTVDNKEILSFLENYFKTEVVETIVLGYPKNLNGNDTDLTSHVLKFEITLKEKFPQHPIVLCDERLTSRMAKQTLIDAGYKKKDRKNKKLVDTVSAALILQTYLESQ